MKDRIIRTKGHIYNKRIHKKIIFVDLLEINSTICKQLVIKDYAIRQIIDRLSLGSYIVCRTRPEDSSGLEEIISIDKLSSNKLLHYSPKNAESWTLPVKMRFPWFFFRTVYGRKLLFLRTELKNFWREFMRKKYFLEVDTPVLTMPSEEGSRNFLVYYRLNPNKFFALAQSPQIYKQLLAYGGINYYQIAPVFRDEDSRKDRVNGEFYQLDVEMEADNLNKVIDFCIELVESTLKYFQISYINIGKITYQDSIETYGSDKPQKENITGQYTYKGKLGLDNPIQIWTIIKFPLTEEDSNGNRTYLNNPFTMTSRDSPDLSEQFDIVLSGIEIVSGGLRETNPRIFQNLLKLTNSNEDFDFLTRGMRSGIYQHGGFGLGLERFLLLICNHINREYNNEICNINEIIPFPLNDRKINKLMGFPKYIDMEE